MIRYAVIPKADAPQTLTTAPVNWEFSKGDTPYVGLEWGDGDEVPKLSDEWLKFQNSNDFNDWLNERGEQLPE